MEAVERRLSINERIEGRGKVSLAALCVAWLSIPVFLFVGFVVAAVPAIYKASNAAKTLQSAGFFAEFNDAIKSIPKPLIIALSIPVCLLILVWIGWGLVTTKRHFDCELVYTDNRVLGTCGGQSLDTEFLDVKNVFVSRSIWGKLFRYGNVTISAKGGSVTFRNLIDPNRLKEILMSKTSQDQWKV